METPITNVERIFPEDQIIVSKTDHQGRITYGNRLFFDLAGYSEAECLGQPHSLVRHPDMPRCIFGLLWETIGAGQELFAYVKNLSKNGDHYWVYAHVTPSFDKSGALVGYHSSRRAPNRQALNETIVPLYRQLLKEEHRHGNRKDGLRTGTQLLQQILASKGASYDEFINAL